MVSFALVILDESKTSNLIVFLKDVEELFIECKKLHAPLRRELPPGVLIIGSHSESGFQGDTSKQHHLIGYFRFKGKHHIARVESNLHEKYKGASKSAIHINKDKAQLSSWKQHLERDAETLKAKTNILKIHKFMIRNEVECNNLEELLIVDQLLTDESVDKIVGYALSSHLQHNSPDIYEDARIVLSTESLRLGLRMVQSIKQSMNFASHNDNKITNKALKNVVIKDKFEKDILSNVIPPNDIGVHFEDIGALENVKVTLKKLVMVPLQRPELFCKGRLTKPVKGVLLFGPAGTGKTLLAKAIATEAGANFINISISSVASKWFGDGEKYGKAIFSLASKISPSVIFIDEYARKERNTRRATEQGSMRRIKNEFMVHWDGLRTKDQERVSVLGATNRPYDLDEAVIRRFSCRVMVDLPDALNRERILSVILSEEKLAPDVDLKTLANMTDGYSGSYLMNLCATVAHCPIDEIIEKEEKDRNLTRAEGRPQPPECGIVDIRPLTMDDFKSALQKASASVSPDSRNMRELHQWNDLYGEGGSRKKTELSYYL